MLETTNHQPLTTNHKPELHNSIFPTRNSELFTTFVYLNMEI